AVPGRKWLVEDARSFLIFRADRKVRIEQRCALPPQHLQGSTATALAWLVIEGRLRIGHAAKIEHLRRHRGGQTERNHLLHKRPARQTAILDPCDQPSQITLVHGTLPIHVGQVALAKSLWPSRFAKVALPKLLCPSHLGECAHPVPRQASRGTPLWDRSDQVSAMPSTRQPMIASTSAHQDGVGSGGLPQAGSGDPSIAPAWVAGGANATSASSAHRTCKPSPLSAVLAAELLRARREHAPRRAA